MRVGVDLHMHSAYSSDGEFSPEAVIDRCAERGLELCALTDHNSVRGVAEAEKQARERGIGLLPGIEIDCCFEGTDLHLLGYGIDWRSPDFVRLEENYRRKVLASFGEMIENIQRSGFSVDAQAVLAAAGEQLPTAELIAEVMLADERYRSPLLEPYLPGGARSDMPYINFYLDWFAQGKPAFVPVEFPAYREAVEVVRDNGGIPVVAHPGLNFRGRERIAEKLLERGAAGLEVFNNYHTPEQVAYFAPLVRRQGLMMTCGSDFHGKTKPRIEVGQFCPPKRYEAYLYEAVNTLKRNGAADVR